MADTSLVGRSTDARVVLVTGGSGVIGAAIAEELGRAGFCVAVHYREGKKSADDVVERIVAAGGKAFVVESDLSRAESIGPMFDRVEQQLGAVHYLINNAGVNRDALLAFMSDEQWDEVIDINLRGTYLCSRLALRGMMRRGGGAICNIISPAGVSRPARTMQLLSIERRHSRFHQGTRSRGWTIWDPGERGLPRRNPQPDVRQIY